METFPGTTVPASLHDVDFMVKDSKRFADSRGWGYAMFEHDPYPPATGGPARFPTILRKATTRNAASHVTPSSKGRDYVFTDFGKR